MKKTKTSRKEPRYIKDSLFTELFNFRLSNIPNINSRINVFFHFSKLYFKVYYPNQLARLRKVSLGTL